jgi:acetyltransferase
MLLDALIAPTERLEPEITWDPIWRSVARPAPIVIREVRADDGARLRQFFLGLSHRMRHRRFHGVVNDLPPAVIARFVGRNDPDEVGLLAVQQRAAGDTVIGEARYAVNGPGRTAEFAMAIADAAQGLGLGRRLLGALVRHAAGNGITALYGDVLPDNRPMLGLTQALGFDERRDPGDPRLRQVRLRIAKP